jgi:type II secretory pathway pseudopilin PulG
VGGRPEGSAPAEQRGPRSRQERPLSRIRRRWRDRHGAGADAGFTLLELTIAAALMVVVIGSFGAVATLMMGTETNAVAGENTSTAMRFVVTQVQSDIQAAVPNPNSPINSNTGLVALSAPFSGAPFNNQLQVQLGPVGSQQTVTWTYDPTQGTLTRALSASPTSAPTSTQIELTGIVNTSSQPVFTYFGQQQVRDLGSTATQNADVTNCTVRVQLHLLVSSGRNAPIPEQITDIQLANVVPGSLTCG